MYDNPPVPGKKQVLTLKLAPATYTLAVKSAGNAQATFTVKIQ